MLIHEVPGGPAKSGGRATSGRDLGRNHHRRWPTLPQSVCARREARSTRMCPVPLMDPKHGVVRPIHARRIGFRKSWVGRQRISRLKDAATPQDFPDHLKMLVGITGSTGPVSSRTMKTSMPCAVKRTQPGSTPSAVVKTLTSLAVLQGRREPGRTSPGDGHERPRTSTSTDKAMLRPSGWSSMVAPASTSALCAAHTQYSHAPQGVGFPAIATASCAQPTTTHSSNSSPPFNLRFILASSKPITVLVSGNG